ncbi:hypothetical protein ElyMa_001892000 [Elysia marginata]|uniref:Uncharacterized protein n=1 Tax=Elysia marginata TaxID=1093978 RepID=A0AAV4ER70_9GAST|nr:hypothetical protein ElyMa_001892000 [Elysia marginata]
MMKHVSKQLCTNTKTITANTLSEMLTDDCDVSTGTDDVTHTSPPSTLPSSAASAAQASVGPGEEESGQQTTNGAPDTNSSRKRPNSQRRSHENRPRKQQRSSADSPRVVPSHHRNSDDEDENGVDNGEEVDICSNSDHGDDGVDENNFSVADGPTANVHSLLQQGPILNATLEGKAKTKFNHSNPLDYCNSLHFDRHANGRSQHAGIGNSLSLTSAPTGNSRLYSSSPPSPSPHDIMSAVSSTVAPHSFSIESLTASHAHRPVSSADTSRRRLSQYTGSKDTSHFVFSSNIPSENDHKLASLLAHNVHRQTSGSDRLSSSGVDQTSSHEDHSGNISANTGSDVERVAATSPPPSPCLDCDDHMMKRRKSPHCADSSPVKNSKTNGGEDNNPSMPPTPTTTATATPKRAISSRPSFLISDILGVTDDQSTKDNISSNGSHNKPAASTPTSSTAKHDLDNNNKHGIPARHHIGLYTHPHTSQHPLYSHNHHQHQLHHHHHHHHHPHPYSLYNNNNSTTANMAATAALALGNPYNFPGLNPGHPALGSSYQRSGEGQHSPHSRILPPGLDPSTGALDSSYDEDMMREDDEDNDDDEGDDGRDNDSISEAFDLAQRSNLTWPPINSFTRYSAPGGNTIGATQHDRSAK